ncbi:NADP-dependent oxidoreductase [Marinobacterium jannaschii]|uniref:NADP-dependent oxidoreductase n=1 Tax=Marinobacterium jannaschii TaxID=64970 RepID=UPI0004864611|nr:NADP-dependent oxidoreductase [Marinobacterium jannaschii]
MKAIQIHQFKSPAEPQYGDVAEPQLNSGEVLIRNRAAGINPIDWKTCSGGGAAPFIGELPFIPGWEFAGEIEQADAESAFKPGDRVLGFIRFPQAAGCFAEKIAAPAAEIAPCPAALDAKTAAALPLAGLTAWQALFDKGNLQAGQRVLILAAAGGVGHLAVQLAKQAGAYVIATASEKNHRFLQQLGADETLDYNSVDISSTVSAIDLVLDGIGGDSGIAALQTLTPGGTLVTLPSVTKDAVIAAGEALGLKVEPIRVEPNAVQLSELAQRCAAGALKLQLANSYPISRTAEAFAESASGHVQGKIVITL